LPGRSCKSDLPRQVNKYDTFNCPGEKHFPDEEDLLIPIWHAMQITRFTGYVLFHANERRMRPATKVQQ